MAIKWIRLDNTSNIFLAARNDIDTKVFRLSATMKETVDPVLLQAALETTYQEYPLFHSVLRQGIFWYYLEISELKPQAVFENDTPCAPIYHSGQRNLLFRVIYRDKHIHFEVFHALTDGTGAMWFFEDLLAEYARLHYIQEENSLYNRKKADLEDSFHRYFNKKKNEIEQTSESLDQIYEEKKMDQQELSVARTDRPAGNIYRIKGELTPDQRPRVISLDIDVQAALKLAKKEKVSLTIYMTALYLLSVYEAKPAKAKPSTVSISIPINLRQFFPSVSVRNFFSTTILFYTFRQNETVDVSVIGQELARQFKNQLKKEELEKRLRRYIEFQKNPFARIMPRVMKDFVLKLANKWNNRQITVAMSNLGIVNLPEVLSGVVDNISFYTSVIRPQFCMVTYGDNLNISFTSPFIETNIHKNFIRHLTEKGLEVTVDVNKVTSEELAKR